MSNNQYTIGKYIYWCLEQLGIQHIFGVPGDYIFDLLHLTFKSGVQFIGTCNELNAGYAADAYARTKGIGALLVTYAVGGLSVVNAVAGAYAEKVPLIVISGGPKLSDYSKQQPIHHTLGDYGIPLDIFKKITVVSECLLDPRQAPAIIDKALIAALQYRKPVYLEVPCDLAKHPCAAPGQFSFPKYVKSDLQDKVLAFNESLGLLNQAKQPTIFVGNEVERYRLQGLVDNLIIKSGYKFSTFITDKNIFFEQHPNFIGYSGPGIRMAESTEEYIASSDCFLCLGSSIAETYLEILQPDLDGSRLIVAADNRVKINGREYDVNLYDFINKLSESYKGAAEKSDFVSTSVDHSQFLIQPSQLPISSPNKKLSNEVLFKQIAKLLQQDDILIVDAGSSLFTARQLVMPDNSLFLSQSYYGSIGYGLPAVLGAALADPTKRILLIVGDGGLQFTCQELSSLIKHNLKPIVFVINNSGYTIERVLYADANYNDIQPWRYHQLPALFGGKLGREVNTETELEEAIEWAQNSSELALIEIHLDKLDCNSELADIVEP